MHAQQVIKPLRRPKRAGARRGSAGFSLVELFVSSVILVLLTYAVTTLTISGGQAMKYAERVNRVTEIAQDTLDEIRKDMTSSVRLFHSDTVGQAYLALLDFTNGTPGISYKLPSLNATGIFEMETVSTPRSGNSVLFARHAWNATYTAASSSEYQVDVYRLVHYYLASGGNGPVNGSAVGLNLVKWVSEPLVDGDQIDQISSSTDRAEILQNLITQAADDDGVTHPSVEVVWLRGEDPGVAATLRHIQSSGNLNNNPQAPRSSPWKIERDERWSTNGMLYYRHHSIATNFAPASYRVGTFSVVSSTGDGFPHGFETQLIGPSAARQLLIRLVLVSTNRNGHPAHVAIQAVIDARDI